MKSKWWICILIGLLFVFGACKSPEPPEGGGTTPPGQETPNPDVEKGEAGGVLDGDNDVDWTGGVSAPLDWSYQY